MPPKLIPHHLQSLKTEQKENYAGKKKSHTTAELTQQVTN